MIGLNSLLPLIDSSTWQWNTSSENSTTINAGGREKVLESSSEKGFLFWNLITIEGEKGYEAEIAINSDLFSIERTFEELFKNGVTSRGPGPLAITRYDTDDDVFAAIYEPRPPLAYNSELTIAVQGSPSDEVTVTSDAIELEITDKQGFMGSIRDLLFQDLINQQEQIASKLDLLNTQTAQTNTILANQLTPDTLEDIAQGETVGGEDDVDVDLGDIVTGGSGVGDGAESTGEEDRDEELGTLGK